MFRDGDQELALGKIEKAVDATRGAEAQVFLVDKVKNTHSLAPPHRHR